MATLINLREARCDLGNQHNLDTDSIIISVFPQSFKNIDFSFLTILAILYIFSKYDIL